MLHMGFGPLWTTMLAGAAAALAAGDALAQLSCPGLDLRAASSSWCSPGSPSI